MKNKTIGMYGGEFSPLHLGHVRAIVKASTMVDRLYVFLSYSENRNEIPHQERFRWLKQVTKDMDNVKVFKMEDTACRKEDASWEEGRKHILRTIASDGIIGIDKVFCGADYKESEIFKTLYPNSEIVYLDREEVNISSTDIRRDGAFKHWDMIPTVSRPYFTKKICIVGTESCGKSNLVSKLANYYNTNYIKEIGREICEEAGGYYNMLPKDFGAIAHMQKSIELNEIKNSNKIMFVDTEATVTRYYLDLLSREMDLDHRDVISVGNTLDTITAQDNYDLYIFLEPDVEWIQDGTRCFGEQEERARNSNMLKRLLAWEEIRFSVVSGSYEERFKKSIEIIDSFMSGK